MLDKKEEYGILKVECKARRGIPPRVWDFVLFFLEVNMVSVNGEDRDYSKTLSLEALLIQENFDPKLVAVEVNQVLVKRVDFSKYQVKDGDKVEVFSFVGGG